MMAIRARRRESADLSEAEWAFLNDEPLPEGTSGWERFRLEHSRMDGHQRTQEALWRAYGAQVLATWTRDRPGTRPRLWWRFDAPRWADPYPEDVWFHGTLPEPRRQIGGKGTPEFETWQLVPEFERGIATRWANLDPADPPAIEAQATYLHRHGLLTVDELALYDAGALDVSPELVPMPDDPPDDPWENDPRRVLRPGGPSGGAAA